MVWRAGHHHGFDRTYPVGGGGGALRRETHPILASEQECIYLLVRSSSISRSELPNGAGDGVMKVIGRSNVTGDAGTPHIIMPTRGRVYRGNIQTGSERAGAGCLVPYGVGGSRLSLAQRPREWWYERAGLLIKKCALRYNIREQLGGTGGYTTVHI